MGKYSIPKMSKGVLVYTVSLLGLGFAEYMDLCLLRWITLIMSIYSSIIMMTILAKYTYYYYVKVKNKKN